MIESMPRHYLEMMRAHVDEGGQLGHLNALGLLAEVERLHAIVDPVQAVSNQPIMIEKPLVIMFVHDGDVVCHLHPTHDHGHEAYGLLICDLVRHVANAFKVEEDAVWHWVDAERYHHTTDIRQPS